MAAAGRASETADIPAAAEQPHDQDDDEDNSEYPSDTVRTTAGMITATIISKAAAKENDQQGLVARIDRLARRGGRYRRTGPFLTPDSHRAI